MTFLLDTNLLMALAWENHDHHEGALGWWLGVPAFATCPITQSGFLRVSCHPQLGYAISPADAFRSLDSILGNERHRFVPDDLSLDAHEIGRDRIKSHNQVTDHYLASLARRHRLCLATFDQPLAAAFATERGLIHLLTP
jgi:uncharacterized protein